MKYLLDILPYLCFLIGAGLSGFNAFKAVRRKRASGITDLVRLLPSFIAFTEHTHPEKTDTEKQEMIMTFLNISFNTLQIELNEKNVRAFSNELMKNFNFQGENRK